MSDAAGNVRFELLDAGTRLGPIEVTVSNRANRRYFESVDVSHPLLDAGCLYPPMAASLTMVLFGGTCDTPVVQTRQRLTCHRRAHADTTLVVTGEVARVYDKRGRHHVDVTARFADRLRPDELIWESQATYVPAAEVRL